MIRKISGKIEEIVENTVSLSNATGVTYEMYMGEYAIPEIQTKMAENETVELHTYHYLEGNVTSSQMIPRLIGFLSKEERELVETMSRQGESTSKIKEKFFEAVKDKKLTDKSDRVREAKTKGYLELLEDIVLNSKTAYKRLFELLVGDKSGISIRFGFHHFPEISQFLNFIQV